VRYEIILAPEAEEDMLKLKASDRAKATDAFETYLRYEPEKTSKSRIKRLEEMDWPKYRLRIDNLRAFYDVIYDVRDDGSEEGIVEILIVREKSEAMKWLAEHGQRTQKDDASTAKSSKG
jgi:mRNA-degrading endonuclease RelE of RelBE toxin-antitoxin system